MRCAICEMIIDALRVRFGSRMSCAGGAMGFHNSHAERFWCVLKRAETTDVVGQHGIETLFFGSQLENLAFSSHIRCFETVYGHASYWHRGGCPIALGLNLTLLLWWC